MFLCTGRYLPLNELKVKSTLRWKGDRRMVGRCVPPGSSLCFNEILCKSSIYCLIIGIRCMQFAFQCMYSTCICTVRVHVLCVEIWCMILQTHTILQHGIGWNVQCFIPL